MQKEAKQYKLALTTFNKKFCNNEEACESFFFKLREICHSFLKNRSIDSIIEM